MSKHREMVMKALRDGPATSSEVAAETGLSIRVASAVLCRMHAAGRINKSDAAGKVGRAYVYSTKVCRPWTTEEIKRLRQLEGSSARVIAAALGRTEAAIFNCAQRQGVTLLGGKSVRWPKSVRDAVRSMREMGIPRVEIIKITGVPRDTVADWNRKSA